MHIAICICMMYGETRHWNHCKMPHYMRCISHGYVFDDKLQVPKRDTFSFKLRIVMIIDTNETNEPPPFSSVPMCDENRCQNQPLYHLYLQQAPYHHFPERKSLFAPTGIYCSAHDPQGRRLQHAIIYISVVETSRITIRGSILNTNFTQSHQHTNYCLISSTRYICGKCVVTKNFWFCLRPRWNKLRPW